MFHVEHRKSAPLSRGAMFDWYYSITTNAEDEYTR